MLVSEAASRVWRAFPILELVPLQPVQDMPDAALRAHGNTNRSYYHDWLELAKFSEIFKAIELCIP